MAEAFTFPSTFLWGAATAAHQVEGNNINNDSWLLEHLPGTIFATPSGDACDHYHRYPEDIALLAELGFNTYRFSIEWARVEPEEGEFSRAVLDHYRRVLTTCRDHGLTPVVTLHHFTSPRWLLAAGGWEDPQTPNRFARYCERVTQHLGDLIGAACTLNEPNLPALLAAIGIGGESPEQRGQIPMWVAAARALGITPDRVAPFQFTASARSFEVKLAAHRAAVTAIKGVRSDVPVGWTLANADIQAGPGGEERAAILRHEINEIYLEAVRGDDFVGIQTYGRMGFGSERLLPPDEGLELNMMRDEVYPEALEATIRQATVAGIPVLVTENGLATADDTRRIAYVERARHGVANCLRDGIDVRGYIYWTALDNFEWIFGYRPTFGLIAVDRATQERTVKPSGHWLGSVARTQGQALEA